MGSCIRMDVEKVGSGTSTTNCFNRKVAKGGWRASILILGVEVCERLATLGIGMNLVLYLHNRMHLPIPISANAVTNFFGVSFITCLLGGFVADTYLGRFGTIIAGAFIQLIGIIMMVLSSTLPSLSPPPCKGVQACEPANTQQQAVLFGALYMIALGTGGVKSCVSGLGADQFEEEKEEGRKMMQSFFNWFGVGLSMASVVAVTVLAYIQDNMGYGVGYSISAACITFCLSIFLLGSPLYLSKHPIGSPLSLIARILVGALRNHRLQPPSLAPTQLDHHAIHPDSKPSIIHTPQFLFLDKAALSRQYTSDFSTKEHNVWILSSLKEVEEVKKFLRLLPILATTIVFWTSNAQTITFSTEQAATLDRRLGKGFTIPPASLHLFVQLSNIVTLILYDKVIIPLARKWRSNDYGITTLQRIGAGLVFAIISVLVASLVEKKRLKVAHNLESLSGHKINALPLSVFYLAPQYCLVGIGEAFGYIGQLEFFYRESPDRMRSLGTGLCFTTISLGFFLSTALVNGVSKWTRHGSHKGWITNDLNTSRLDCFYLFIALCSFISFLAYLACSYWYVYDANWGLHNKSHSGEVAPCINDKSEE